MEMGARRIAVILVSCLLILVGCAMKKKNQNLAPMISSRKIAVGQPDQPPEPEAFTLAWTESGGSSVSVTRYLHGNDGQGKELESNAPITLPQLVPDTLTVAFKDDSITVLSANLVIDNKSYPLGVTRGSGTYSLAGFRTVLADDKEQDAILSINWVTVSQGNAGQIAYITNVEIMTPPAPPTVQISARSAGDTTLMRLDTPNARLDLVEIITLTNNSSRPIEVEISTNLNGASLHRTQTVRTERDIENPPTCTHQDSASTTQVDLAGNYYVFGKDYIPGSWTQLLNASTAIYRVEAGAATQFYVYGQNSQFAAWMDGGIPVSHYQPQDALCGCDIGMQDGWTDVFEKYCPDSVGEDDSPLSFIVPDAVRNISVRFALSPRNQDPETRNETLLPASQVAF